MKNKVIEKVNKEVGKKVEKVNEIQRVKENIDEIVKKYKKKTT